MCLRMSFLGLVAKAVFLAAGTAVGAVAGGAVGGLLAIYLLRIPEQWECVADDSCGPGDGLLWVLGGLPGICLGATAGFVAVGMILMRRTLRGVGIAGSATGGNGPSPPNHDVHFHSRYDQAD